MEQYGDVISKLKQHGYRLTPQRMMILSAIDSSDNHISAEEIYSQIIAKYPSVNISTVYRTLELLKRLGLVTETDLGGGRVRYHPMAKGRHHHLVCRHCGVIIDLDESVFAEVKDVLYREYGFIADLEHLAIFGSCMNCRQ